MMSNKRARQIITAHLDALGIDAPSPSLPYLGWCQEAHALMLGSWDLKDREEATLWLRRLAQLIENDKAAA